MEKKLLSEINRFRQLTGLNIINEQTWADNLAQFGTRIQNLDDIVKSLGKMDQSLTVTDIDNICDELIKSNNITPNLVNRLRKQLKAEKNLRDSLSNSSDDFVSKVRQVANKKPIAKETDEFVTSLNVLRLLNKEQMLPLIRKQIKSMLLVANSKAKILLTNIDDLISGALKEMYDNGNVFYNVDEIWDITDGYIINNLADSEGYISEGLFLEYSSALRSSSKIKDLVDKIKADGLDAGLAKRTPSVSYSKEYKFPDEWFQTSKWKQYKTVKNADGTDIQVAVKKSKSTVVDDASKVTDDSGKVSNATNPPIERRVGTGFGVKETLPTDISDKFYELSKKNISELSDDELSFLNAVKEWKRGSDVDFENLLKPKVDNPDTIIKTIETRTPGFFSKLMNNYTIDTLYNIFRGFYTGQKTAYENLIADSKYITETFLPKFSEAGKKIQAGDINGFQNSVRQLFLDFKLSKPYNKSWDDLWEEVKLDIRKNGKASNIDDSTINEFISQIEKGGANPKNSIESFLKTMENFANKPTILPLGKDRRFAFGNLDAFKEWINIKKFFDDAKASYDNVRTSFKGENLAVGFGNFLYRLPTEIWKWFSGYLVYSAPLRVQTLLARINYNSPRFVPLAATAIGSYLGAVFIDYFVQPVIDSTRYFLDLIFIELFKSPADWFWKGLGLDSKKYEQLSDKNYWDVLFEGYKEPLLKLGEKVITPSLTFQPGPIMLAIPAIIERTKKSKKQVYDEEQTKLTEKKENDVKERLDKAEKRAIEIWNNASYDEKEDIKKKNNFYDYKESIDNGLGAKLTPEQSKKMTESLDFIPGIDPTVRQNLISGTLKDVVKGELTGKEASSVGDVVNSIKDISGSVVVRDRNKVPYKITRREGNMYYLEPSYDELIKNPNQEPISKRLYKFVDKL